jgi:hypothetical protein
MTRILDISENDMKPHLLRLIAEIGGTVELAIDFTEIEEQLARYFGLSEAERNKNKTANGHPLWPSRIRYVRLKLIRENGFLCEKYRDGFWSISEQGYNYLAEKTATDNPLKITRSKDVWGNIVIFVPELKSLPAEGSELFLHRKFELYSDVAQLTKQYWLQYPPEKKYFECELCKFSFWKNYGNGDYSCVHDYIEAHLLIPPEKLQATTTPKINDFQLVCANCHSLLHAKMTYRYYDYAYLKE